MMELREPPRRISPAPVDRTVRALSILNLLLVAGLGAWLLLRGGDASGHHGSAALRTREVASKLKAAGALDQAADLYARYLDAGDEPAEARARIAYSLGTTYLERGRYEEALRWFYETESLGAGPLAGEVGQKIVHALEALGRVHAARSALGSRASLGADEVQRAADDPVVARLGEREIHRSEVERALDDLPPELARAWAEPGRRRDFLRQYVADELLWRKAIKLELDDDPEVRRRHEALLKQLAVSRYLEREVMGKIQVDEADLATFFEANRERYQAPPKREGGEPTPLTFEQARPAVERDYRLFKAQAAYQKAVESELSAGDVEIFEEAWDHGG